MYCRNCGNSMDPNAPICSRCGCARGTGLSFCPACGWRNEPGTDTCQNCGCALKVYATPTAKSKLVAGLLGIILGSLGIHNFYLGYTGRAIAQLLISLLSLGTLSCISGIWGLIEGILYLSGKYTTDANGIPLRD